MAKMASSIATAFATLSSKMVEEKAAAPAPKNENGKPQATYTIEALIERVKAGGAAVVVPGTWGSAATGAPLTEVMPAKTTVSATAALSAQVSFSRFTGQALPPTGTPYALTGTFDYGTPGFSMIAAHGGETAHTMAATQEGGIAGAAGRRITTMLDRALMGDASMVGPLIGLTAADTSYCINTSFFPARSAGLALVKYSTVRMDESQLSLHVNAGLRFIRLTHAYGDALSTDGRQTAESTLSPEFIGDMQALAATFAYDRARGGQPPLSSGESLALITRVFRAVIEDESHPYRKDAENDCAAAITCPSSATLTFSVPEPSTHDYAVSPRVRSIFNTASMPVVAASITPAAGAGNIAAEASAATRAREALATAAAAAVLDKTARTRSSTAAAARLVAAGEGGGRGAGLAAPAPATASLTPTALFGRATRVALTSLCQPEGGPLRKYLQGGGEFCVRNLLNLACALPEGGLCQRQHLQKEVPPGASTSPWESARRGLVTLN